MAYFIFIKDSDGLKNTLYRIAENETDFNYLNIVDSNYKIIQDSQANFNDVKNNIKHVDSYNGNTINYIDANISYNQKSLTQYVTECKKNISVFLEYNKNHPLYQKWNNYFIQLDNLNYDSITYPLNKSLEQYFNDLSQPSLNPLQLP